MSIIDTIEAHRKERGMSIQEFAGKCGKSRNQMSKILKGKTKSVPYDVVENSLELLGYELIILVPKGVPLVGSVYEKQV